FLYRLIEHGCRRGANPFLADDALVVDQNESRPACQSPVVRDVRFALTFILERPPRDHLLFVFHFDVGIVAVAIDAKEDKRFAFKLCDERPLVREHAHARRSPMGPKIEQNHFAAVITQLKRLAVEIIAEDIRGMLTNSWRSFDSPGAAINYACARP